MNWQCLLTKTPYCEISQVDAHNTLLTVNIAQWSFSRGKLTLLMVKAKVSYRSCIGCGICHAKAFIGSEQ